MASMDWKEKIRIENRAEAKLCSDHRSNKTIAKEMQHHVQQQQQSARGFQRS